MLPTDLKTVLANERGAYAWPWSEQLFLDCLEKPARNTCKVLLLEDEVIGHGIFGTVLDEGHVLNLCIARHMQGRGCGRFLLRAMLDEMNQCGIRTVFLEVRCSNRTALALYESEDFFEVGRRENYYPAVRGREAAIVLQRFSLEEDQAARS